MNISLRQLKVFICIAETSSFTRAAQRLHLSQAALSAIIRELETRLQCRLLDRNTRTVSLTEAGRYFLPTAMHIVESLGHAAQELAKMDREERRVVRVGVTPLVAVHFMPTILRLFAQRHPDVDVEMTDRSPGELLQLVEAAELDAAYGAFFDKASGIERTLLFPSCLAAVVPTEDVHGWFPDVREDLTWSALQDMPLLVFPRHYPIQRLVDERLVADSVTVGKRIEVGQMDTAMALAEAGFGIGILPSLSQASYARFKVRMHPIRPLIEVPFYCITRSGRGNTDMVEQFSAVYQEVVGAVAVDPPPAAPRARTRRRKVD